MKKSNVIHSAFLFFILFVSGCKKNDSLIVKPLNQNQKIMQEQFKSFFPTIGNIDLNSIKESNNSDNKQIVLTSKIKDSNKKYILLVDNRKKLTVFKRFIFDSNIPPNLKNNNEKSYNGFAELTSLESDGTMIKIEFKNGIKSFNVFSNNLTNQTFAINSSPVTQMTSPLTDCVVNTMKNMSIGEWAVFIATEPDSMAGLILACAINIIVK